jgi:septum formation protein
MTNTKIVLCSASPRRQQLLKALGFEFELQVKDVDESFPAHLKSPEVAVFLAGKKAEAFSKEFQEGKIYITADTIVSLEEKEVLGKPSDAEDAFDILKKLSGNAHQVYTGVCLSSTGNKKKFTVKSNVHFRVLNDEEIKYYIQQYSPFDKAGAYGAQECLPEGMNPCSEEEKKFLESIHKPELFNETLPQNKSHIPIISRIEGSYFNVMGLPIAELYKEILDFKI